METQLTVGALCLSVIVIFRPPPSKKNRHTVNNFLDEFDTFLSERQLLGGRDIIMGDFNFDMGNSKSADAKKFLHVLSSNGYTQLITDATHSSGHVLDLVITRSSDSAVRNIWVHDALISDHQAVQFAIETNFTAQAQKTILVRKTKDINLDSFLYDILESDLIKNPSCDLDHLVGRYNTCLSAILDKHAPLKKKVISIRQKVPWYDDKISAARAEKKNAEHKWRQTGLTVNWEIYKQKRNILLACIEQSKKTYLTSMIADNSTNQGVLFKTVNELFNKTKSSSMPTSSTDAEISEDFARFFTHKVDKIQDTLKELRAGTEPFPEMIHQNLSTTFPFFNAVTVDEIEKIIKTSPVKSSNLDPIPTTLLKNCLHLLLPSKTSIINLSLSSATVPSVFKHAAITPILK